MTATQKYEEPKYTPIREFVTDGYGEVHPKIDLSQGGVDSTPIVDTARDTYTNLILAANLPTGKKFNLQSLILTNLEAGAIRVELFDDTTLKFTYTVPATSSIALNKDDLIGINMSTSVRFKTQGGAFSAGFYTQAGGFYNTA